MKLDVAERSITERLTSIPWERAEADLDAFGGAVLEHLLTAQECNVIAAMYARDERFRSRVVMARHGFGSGEYKYFSYPLPGVVECLRTELYPRLAPIAKPLERSTADRCAVSREPCGVPEALS
jgi:hypothetical protein